METQKQQTIEERLVIAKRLAEEANAEVIKYEKIEKKKVSLQNNFEYLMNSSDSDISRENNHGLYGRNVHGCLSEFSLSDSASKKLHELYFRLEQYYSGTNELGRKIREQLSIYGEKICNRTITEQEYSSLLDGTEPFLGRYLQRVDDKRKRETEDFHKSVEREERDYNRKQGTYLSRSARVEQNTQVQRKLSLWDRILGGKK